LRAKADIRAIQADLIAALSTIRKGTDLDAPGADAAWAEIETFCAIALRVMAKTNPSKLRDAAMAEEIKARVQGREVLD
jgi:hypothetical protein